MSSPFLAEIIMVGFNFPPRGWALCDGQILPINQNQSLYSLLGTTYGGDGRTSFALPDLRGRTPVHSGNGSAGAGLTPRPLGQKSGQETHTLTSAEMPTHSHAATTTLHAVDDDGGTDEPGDHSLANASTGTAYTNAAADATLSSAAAVTTNQNTGGGQAHDNMQPYLAVNFIIALQGQFPSRN